MKTYTAPWGRTLKVCSCFIILLALVFFFGTALIMGHLKPPALVHLTQWGVPLIVLATLPFMVRGYAITGNEIVIRRLFWSTRLPLAGLKSAEVVANAMKGCMRLCGNGGAFSFSGWFWSKSLGGFRPYVTDLNRTVVLRFPGKTVVLSPGDPHAFVSDLEPRLVE